MHDLRLQLGLRRRADGRRLVHPDARTPTPAPGTYVITLEVTNQGGALTAITHASRCPFVRADAEPDPDQPDARPDPDARPRRPPPSPDADARPRRRVRPPVANFTWSAGNHETNVTSRTRRPRPRRARSRTGCGSSSMTPTPSTVHQRPEPVPRLPEQQRDVHVRLTVTIVGRVRDDHPDGGAVMRALRRRGRRSRGQSLVEFALVLPIFLLLLFGLIDGGRLDLPAHRPVAGGPRGRPRGVGRGELDRRVRHPAAGPPAGRSVRPTCGAMRTDVLNAANRNDRSPSRR